MKVTHFSKETPHGLSHTSPDDAPKVPSKLDDRKNNHPSIETPKSGSNGDPESSKLGSKALGSKAQSVG